MLQATQTLQPKADLPAVERTECLPGGICEREVDDSIQELVASVKPQAHKMLKEAGQYVEEYTHWEVVQAKSQTVAGANIWAKVKVLAYKRNPDVLKSIERGENICFPTYIASVLVQNKEPSTALEVVVHCEDGHEEAFTLAPAERRKVEVIKDMGSWTAIRPIRSMRTRPVILGGDRGANEGWIHRELGPVTQLIHDMPVVLDKFGGDLQNDPAQKGLEPEVFVNVKIFQPLPYTGKATQVLAVQAPKTKADKLEFF